MKDWAKAKACVYMQKEWLPQFQEFIDTYAEKHRWCPFASVLGGANDFCLQAPFSTIASMEALMQAHISFSSENFRPDPEKRKLPSEEEELSGREGTGSENAQDEAEE